MTRMGILLAGLTVLALSGAASAQTRFYGTLQCDPQTGGSRGAIANANVAQEKCIWSLPLQIGSEVAAGAQNSITSNRTGTVSKDTGTQTNRMTNSDEFVLNLTGTSVLDGGGQPRSRTGSWTVASGTGLLKGMTGSGTYTGNARAAGGMSYDLEGTYQLASAAQGTAPANTTPSSNTTTPDPPQGKTKPPAAKSLNAAPRAESSKSPRRGSGQSRSRTSAQEN
jgi:hypothetical protein